MAEYCKDEFISEIEKQLDDYKNDPYTAIDVLEINLGIISSSQWKVSIKEKFDEVLRAQLEKPFIQNMDLGAISYDPSETFNKDNPDNALQKQLRKFDRDGQAKAITENSHFKDMTAEAFGFFIEKGFLPWWYPQETAPEISRAYQAHLSSERATTLLPKLRDNPTARQRFLGTMAQNKVDSFLNLAGIPKKITDCQSLIYKALTKTIIPELKEKKFRSAFWEALIIQNTNLRQVSTNTKTIFLKSILSHPHVKDELNRIHQKSKKISIQSFSNEIQKLWPDLHIEKQFFENEINPFENRSRKKPGPREKRTRAKKDRPESGNKPNTRKDELENTEKQEIKDLNDVSLSETVESDKNQQKPSDTEAQEGVYVHHAGIVLLHPFLLPFFTKLNLLENKQWKSDESLKKGVHLLAYLSVGSMQCPEYECLLFKHLCGLSWDTVIEPRLDLSPAELKEADGLLQSVLEHWTALKNTSVAGLREGFIERSGKLWKDENGWQLHVEQKAQDVLLQRLPWGLGVIKFPWQKELLRTSWF